MERRVLMIGPHPPAVGGLANNMRLLEGSGLTTRFQLIPFSTAKRRQHVFPNRPHWDSLPYLFWHVAKLKLALLQHRPHVVYIKATSDTGFVRDVALMAVCRFFRRPVLCHLHGRPMGKLFGGDGAPVPGFTRWGMSLAQATLVLSPGLARAFGVMFPKQPLVVVPNVVETERFRPAEAGATPGPVRILTVGRLSREKGTWDLLETAKSLVESGREVRFRLCGIGETPGEEAAIREKARTLKLDGVVEFAGVLKGEALVAAYQEADLFYLPTHAEIFPNVVLEALASGLPVVTTNVPVIPEMFSENVEGVFVKPKDISEHAFALTGLVDNTDRRRSMGVAARELAETKYGVDVAAARIGDALQALAEGRAVSPRPT